MDSMFPAWLLPLWIIGAPLIGAIALSFMSGDGRDHADRDQVDNSLHVHKTLHVHNAA